jgi:hypothetical protein
MYFPDSPGAPLVRQWTRHVKHCILRGRYGSLINHWKVVGQFVDFGNLQADLWFADKPPKKS